jgi:hypothetical protein
MSVTIKSTYQKVGATFANGVEAHNDKNSLFSSETRSVVEACYANMLANGILLEPVSYSWNQETSILEIVKVVSSPEEYAAAVTFNGPAVIQAATDAGWVFIPPVVPG